MSLWRVESYIADTLFYTVKYVPEWMPGANFQKVAKDHVQTITRFARAHLHSPRLKWTGEKIGSALFRRSSDKAKTKKSSNGWRRQCMAVQAIRYVLITLICIFILIHTKQTTAILEGFFLAMMLFPDVQRKAQAEMDELFGKPALPSATDRERLPYVNAIVKEATRWLTVAPLGIPHRTDQDDIINGYLIPKNAIIVPNTWYYHPHIPHVPPLLC